MTSIIEFTDRHMTSSIDVTFERRYAYPHLNHPCAGHFFGGIARVDESLFPGGMMRTGDKPWICILVEEWTEWEIADDSCTCGASIKHLRTPPDRHRIMFDDNERLITVSATRRGARFWAWNTHGLHDGESEKLAVTLLEPRDLPLW